MKLMGNMKSDSPAPPVTAP